MERIGDILNSMDIWDEIEKQKYLVHGSPEWVEETLKRVPDDHKFICPNQSCGCTGCLGMYGINEYMWNAYMSGIPGIPVMVEAERGCEFDILGNPILEPELDQKKAGLEVIESILESDNGSD